MIRKRYTPTFKWVAAWGLSSFLFPPTPAGNYYATYQDYSNQYALVTLIVGLVSESVSIGAIVTSVIALPHRRLQGLTGLAVPVLVLGIVGIVGSILCGIGT